MTRDPHVARLHSQRVADLAGALVVKEGQRHDRPVAPGQALEALTQALHRQRIGPALVERAGQLLVERGVTVSQPGQLQSHEAGGPQHERADPVGGLHLARTKLRQHQQHHPLHELVHGAVVPQAAATVEADPPSEAPEELRLRRRAAPRPPAQDRAGQLGVARIHLRCNVGHASSILAASPSPRTPWEGNRPKAREKCERPCRKETKPLPERGNREYDHPR